MTAHDDRYPQGSRREVLDGTPMAVPIGFRRPPSLIEQMRAMIRNEVSEAAQMSGRETFEESNDFDIPDDPDDPHTPWEDSADGDDQVAEGLQDARHAREARKAGWRRPAAQAPWEQWAQAQGWQPPPSPSPKPSSSAEPKGPSAGPNNGGNPNASAEASMHSPST